MDSFFVQSFMFKKHRVPQKQMDGNFDGKLIMAPEKNVQEEMHKIWFIYQHEILWIYDSSLCLGMGECLFLIATFQSDSCCLSLYSPYPQDPPIFQMSTPPMENSEPYIHAGVSDLPLS